MYESKRAVAAKSVAIHKTKQNKENNKTITLIEIFFGIF
jgi:hypothetical protein